MNNFFIGLSLFLTLGLTICLMVQQKEIEELKLTIDSNTAIWKALSEQVEDQASIGQLHSLQDSLEERIGDLERDNNDRKFIESNKKPYKIPEKPKHCDKKLCH